MKQQDYPHFNNGLLPRGASFLFWSTTSGPSVQLNPAETRPAPSQGQSLINSPRILVEGEDHYCEGPAIVFTASYLRRRGYCCESGCRYCPYDAA